MADDTKPVPPAPAFPYRVPVVVGVGASAAVPADIERFFSGYHAKGRRRDQQYGMISKM